MLFWAILISTVVYAQNTTIRHQVWLGAVQQFHIKGKWGLWLDEQYRTWDNLHNKVSTVAIRIGVIYQPIKDLRIVAGYAYFRIFPLNGNLPAPHEHRGWQMIQWTLKTPKMRLIQGIRTEQRFRERIKQNKHTAKYAFNHRFRYNINATFPFRKANAFQPKSLAYTIGNEVMFNVGKEIIWNTFDQNRAWIGLQYQINPKLSLQVFYMLLYQHLPQPNQYLLSNNIRITLQYQQ